MNTIAKTIAMAGTVFVVLGGSGCGTKTVAGPTLPPLPPAATGPVAPRPKPQPTPDPFAPYPIPQKPETGVSPLSHGPDTPLYRRQQ